MLFRSKNTNLNIKNAVCYCTFKNFESFNFIKHGFSTRLGGVSDGDCRSLNFCFSKNDTKQNVSENYRRFAEALDINEKKIIKSYQMHTDNIAVVKNNHQNFKSEIKQGIDGLLTNKRNITLLTFHADCAPIFFVDPLKRAVGVAHSGWEGTAKEIASKMIAKFRKEFSSNEEDLFCAIGPSIGQCCYEIDDFVYNKFRTKKYISKFCFKKSKDKNKFMFSLKIANQKILENAGVKPSNILVSDLCTKCCSDLFFSHRKSGNKRGVMAAAICLK
ncbi:MAG: peptidoglycan editing factor PgeF [Oscillospiraceae bacterium]|nr:peptidoglycan editing factor PgeF [Oscillospiraceae bacterium]